MVEPVAVEGDREWSEEELLLPDLNNAADRDWRLNFDSFQLSELKEKPPPRGLHHSCLGVLRPEDNVAGYYQQQVEMLEGFNEMDALAQRGFLIGMSKEDKEKLARSETTAIRLSNVANMILFAAKVYASVRSGSLAIIASTLDSLLDLLSGFILWFTAFSMQTPNPYQYPIGKKRMQPLGILVFASVMATLGLQIILESVRTLISVLALYTIRTWSLTVLENVNSLVGKSAAPKYLQKLTYLCWNHHKAIRHIDTVRAYTFGSHYFVEVDIVLPASMPLQEAHDIGEALQEKLELLPEIERAFVHLDYEYTHKPEHAQAHL
ncbi:metal tolerance protein 5-like isoform X2 [Camellia sinensis]|uniref:metal tolerance protein 5-like isoform X2 n=1 Tax=Camellia sinensis TaxID=4442 RepID=UPI001035B39B|nr:metal tolerance protein 5-like isoform X2 [Camellia sinensis]